MISVSFKMPHNGQYMRSLVDRFGSDPEKSGSVPGAHVALSFFITGYLNKVAGFWDVSQHGFVQCKMRENQIEYAH
jgi:hypothetical protein